MPTYETPSWAKPGCLPRETKVGEYCPTLDSSIKIIPMREWSDLVGEVSLRPFVKTILHQNGFNSCATDAVTQAVQASETFAGKPHVLLNPWTLYCFTSGGRDRGSTIDGNLRQARDVGILPESVWPRNGPNGHAWHEKPPLELFAEHAHKIDEFFDITSIDQFGTGLLQGFPQVYGRRVHALMGNELLSERDFGFTNSYGIEWGDQGHGREALSGIEWQYGAFAVRTVTRPASSP